MSLRITPAKRRAPEPTIALINVVFLMLVFFLIAGTIAPPMDGEVQLVLTKELEGQAPPNALVLHEDGRVSYRGETIDPELFDFADLSTGKTKSLRLIPDRNLAASDLLKISGQFQARGAEKIVVVTERGLD